VVRLKKSTKIDNLQLSDYLRMCKSAQFHFDTFDDKENWILQSALSNFSHKFKYENALNFKL